MSTDVAAESSSAPLTEVSDLFYNEGPPPPAESAPASEHSSAPASEKEVSETASVSETETHTEESKSLEPKPSRSNAETRIQQLLAENKRLKAEREAPRTEAPKVEAPKTAAPAAEEQPPDPGKFDTWAEYQKAHGEFTQKQIAKQVQDAIQRDRTEQQRLQTEQQQRDAFETQKQAQLDRVKDAEARHADFKQKVFDLDESGKVVGLHQDLQLHPVVDNFIPQSKVGMELLYHFATNPAEQARFLKLEPYDALREAIQLEAKLTDGLQTPPQRQRIKPPSTVSGTGGQPKARDPEEVLYGAD